PVEGSAALGWLAAWGALPIVAFVGWLAARPRRSSGAHDIVVEHDVVRIRGPALSCTFPVSSVTGLLRGEAGGTCIDLTISRRRTIAIDLDSPAEATALIEQLGYAAARRHVVMLDRPVRAVTAPLLSLLVAFLALVPLSIVFHAASDAVWIAVLASPPLI